MNFPEYHIMREAGWIYLLRVNTSGPAVQLLKAADACSGAIDEPASVQASSLVDLATVIMADLMSPDDPPVDVILLLATGLGACRRKPLVRLTGRSLDATVKSWPAVCKAFCQGFTTSN